MPVCSGLGVWELKSMERGVAMTSYRVGVAGLFVLFSVSSGMAQFVPGGIDSVGLTRIVPDTLVSDNGGLPALGNWEPYASVLGNSVFLIEGNTYAEGSGAEQRYVVMFQKVEGGTPVLGEVFFADDGSPYRGKINNSRQNGNPGRVGGDRRPGARNLMAGGEASPHTYVQFQSDNRWTLLGNRGDADRYGAVQIFSLDPSTLVQTPRCKAFDAVLGRLTVSMAPSHDSQVSRFGGDIVGLSDGSFLAVVEERSGLISPTATPAVAAVFNADGAVVRDSFCVGPGGSNGIWANVAAYQGGFCIRYAGILYFYDNLGNPVGNVDQDTNNPFKFDRGRGDNTRLAGHVNSPFVFLVGPYTTTTNKKAYGLAAWDSRDQSFVAFANVNELTSADGGTDPADFQPVSIDRTNLAVDAYSRVTVVYEGQLAGFSDKQTFCRVLALDYVNKKFTYMTPSFAPFVNYLAEPGASGAALRTYRPTVAVTTRQICVAAKGEINYPLLQPELGPNTPKEVNFYTVFTHPEPKSDPTPPVEIPVDCPSIEAVSPATAVIVRPQVNLTITGAHFVAGQTSVMLLAAGQPDIVIPATSVEVAADGLSLSFALDLTGAAPGSRNVIVSVAGSSCPMAVKQGGFNVAPCFTPWADSDGDGDVDHTDFGAWQVCFTGVAGVGFDLAKCGCFDRDANSTVDAADFLAFEKCCTGPTVAWAPSADCP